MSYQYDHRQLADEMDIFFFDEQIGVGLPVWLPNGVAIRDELEAFIRQLEREGGYKRVVSPHLAKSILYEKSGHLSSFKENMFPPIRWPEDGQNYYLRPMNCPHHHKIFASSPRSYRQLPLRFAEYGQVYRYELSGSLRGLSRVRGLCQNDAHIYIDAEESFDEIVRVIRLHERCYRFLGLKGYRYRLSKGDPNQPDIFQGELRVWIHAEEILRKALLFLNLDFFEAVGEGAFYGPKIDVQMKMGGVEESIASVQLDFLSADRFDLSYVSKSGQRKCPWIIHRAPLGSHERFVALLLEYFDGQMPGWLSPIQLYLIPVSEPAVHFAKEFRDQLLLNGIRVEVDDNSGSLSKRIHFAHRYRPFSKLVIGPKELASGKMKLQLRENDIFVNQEGLINKLKQLCNSPLSD